MVLHSLSLCVCVRSVLFYSMVQGEMPAEAAAATASQRTACLCVTLYYCRPSDRWIDNKHMPRSQRLFHSTPQCFWLIFFHPARFQQPLCLQHFVLWNFATLRKQVRGGFSERLTNDPHWNCMLSLISKCCSFSTKTTESLLKTMSLIVFQDNIWDSY